MKVAITHTVVMAAPKSVLTSRAVLARSKSNWCESTKRQLATQGRNWTIGQLDESCISNSKSEIGNWTVQSPISDFEFEMQDSSNCPIVQFLPCVANCLFVLSHQFDFDRANTALDVNTDLGAAITTVCVIATFMFERGRTDVR